MKKRVLMSLVLLVIIGTSAVFAQQPTLDKLRIFAVNNGASYQADAANKNISGAVVIPDTYNGKPVTNAGDFMNCTGITSVTIPNSITAIVINAFRGCTGITSITIPASVTEFRGYAFRDCTNLTSITFQGTSINLRNTDDFPGDLRAKYQAGGAGTYTRSAGGTVWTKQGEALCPYCGQPLPPGFKRP